MTGDELKRYRFPETLTNQSRWFGLYLDELIPAVICLGWGFWTSKFIFGIASAVLVFWGIKKLKKGRGSSWLRDLIYWYLPTSLLKGFFHDVPDSCFRQWIKSINGEITYGTWCQTKYHPRYRCGIYQSGDTPDPQSCDQYYPGHK